jgi:type I restriction enzyme S subunit
MTAWSTIPLGGLGRIVTGRTPPSSQEQFFTGEIPFFTPTDIDGEHRLVITGRHVSAEWDREQSRINLPPKTVCVVCIGATIGKVCLTSIHSQSNQQINSIIVDQSRFDPLFVYYRLRSMREELKKRAAGAATPILNKSAFSDITIEVPTLDVQRRIASILGTYDDLIEVNLRRIALLEEICRRLFEEWFVRFRFPGHEDHAMVETPDGPLPEGWQLKRLADMCASIEYGYTASSEPEAIGPKFLRITDIVPPTIDWSTVPHCQIEKERTDKYSLREGDIVVARTGATVGYAKRINKRHPTAIYASYLVRLRPLPEMSSSMIGIFVQSDAYKSYIKSHAGGAAQPNANAKVLSGIRLTVPSDTVQRRFQAVVEPMCDVGEVLQMQNSALASSRDILLPRLVSGEVSVTSAERELEAVA